jgi:hypothetical protein
MENKDVIILGAYRKYARLFNVRMQYCMAHLIRDIRFLAEHSVKKLSRGGYYAKKRIETFLTLSNSTDEFRINRLLMGQ